MEPLKVSSNINIVHAGGGIWKHQSEVRWRRLCEGRGHAAAADSHVRGNRRWSAWVSYVQDLLKGKSGSLMMHCVLWHQEELQKRIVEEQQNNNLSVEILNGNTESLTGLVGNAQALKEPGIDQRLSALWLRLRGCLIQMLSSLWCPHPHRTTPG